MVRSERPLMKFRTSKNLMRERMRKWTGTLVDPQTRELV